MDIFLFTGLSSCKFWIVKLYGKRGKIGADSLIKHNVWNFSIRSREKNWLADEYFSIYKFIFSRENYGKNMGELMKHNGIFARNYTCNSNHDTFCIQKSSRQLLLFIFLVRSKSKSTSFTFLSIQIKHVSEHFVSKKINSSLKSVPREDKIIIPLSDPNDWRITWLPHTGTNGG